MPAVTQQIPNFLGGVSRQIDAKKQPGQVTDILNGFPDPAFGLIKRNGNQFLFEAVNDTGGLLTDGYWFEINRDEDEAYIGVVTNAGDIRIWNLIPTLNVDDSYTFAECTIADKGDADVIAYLASSKAKDNITKVTYADQTYLINKSKTVAMQAKAAFYPKRYGTIIITLTGGGVYTITLNGTDYSHTAGSGDTAEHILTQLASALPGTFTTTIHGSSMDITASSDFTLSVNAGDSSGLMTSYQDTVASPSFLAANSIDGRRVQVLNSLDTNQSYFAKFVAENGTAGSGYWQEDLGWEDGANELASAGFDATTMPYKLVNTSKNNFSIGQETWAPRATGNDVSCPIPSFVGKQIAYGLLNSNRLAFLSSNSIVLSTAKDISNFFYTTAQTITASDPIDVDAPSSRVSRLHSAISKPQGLIVFSEFEQFLLYSESGNLTPFDSVIRSVGQYENVSNVEVKDVGPYISFISRTALSSKVFGMQFRVNDATPSTVDISQVVAGYLPDDIEQLVADPQNSLIAAYSPTDKNIYMYKFYSNGQEQLMQSWFKWNVPGDVQHIQITHNILFFVTKSGAKYNVSLVSLIQDPFPLGRRFGEAPADLSTIAASNARLDFLYLPLNHGTITYDAVSDRSTLPRPYTHISGKTPVAVVIPQVTAVQPTTLSDLPKLFLVSSPSALNAGYILEIDSSDWSVPGDWTGYEDKLVVGYEFPFEVELPTYYYRSQNDIDWSSSLIIARMKFNVGLTGVMSFQIKRFGSINWTYVQSVVEAGRYLGDTIPLVQDKVFTVPIHQRNDNFQLKAISTSPFPATLSSMMWEGNYSNKYYRRA